MDTPDTGLMACEENANIEFSSQPTPAQRWKITAVPQTAGHSLESGATRDSPFAQEISAHEIGVPNSETADLNSTPTSSTSSRSLNSPTLEGSSVEASVFMTPNIHHNSSPGSQSTQKSQEHPQPNAGKNVSKAQKVGSTPKNRYGNTPPPIHLPSRALMVRKTPT